MEAQGPVGTPPYMSPEQARGNPDEMDERTDVFGLGAILYQIVSGQVPYGDGIHDAQEILARARAGQTVSIDAGDAAAAPREAHPRHRRRRAIAADPAERYESVAELAERRASLPARRAPPAEQDLRAGRDHPPRGRRRATRRT